MNLRSLLIVCIHRGNNTSFHWLFPNQLKFLHFSCFVTEYLKHLDYWWRYPQMAPKKYCGINSTNINMETSFQKIMSQIISNRYQQNAGTRIPTFSKLIRNGSNIKGYFVWSFLDIFEATGGFTYGFGMLIRMIRSLHEGDKLEINS